MRGTKPHKHVWIAHCQIPWPNGHVEKFICGVFANQQVAVDTCQEEGNWQGHGPFTADGYRDGDVYLYDKTGNQRYVIQRHPVEINNQRFHHRLESEEAP